MSPFISFLHHELFANDEDVGSKIRLVATQFTLMTETLYIRRNISPSAQVLESERSRVHDDQGDP